jgi:endonuclease/exonuclease/phosphatase (EEP) superfamily protein YafD
VTVARETDGASRTRFFARSSTIALWTITLAYAGLVLARYVAWDANRYLAELNAQTVWLFLPAYIIASAASCFRRFGLAIVAMVAVAFHLVTVVPSIGEAEPIPAVAAEAPPLRIVSANVRFSNPTKEKLARELLDVRAHVLLLQETTEHWLDVLGNLGFDDRYPHRVARTRSDSRGMAIYSKLPLTDVRIVQPDDSPTIVARVAVDGRPVSLLNAHAVGPSEGITAHRESVDVIRELTRDLPRPRVIAGDFNATPYNRTMHRMADMGLDSAHERRGRGLAVTWPSGKRWLGPIRVDHVLVDGSIAVIEVRELDGSGSDHRPVVADLAIL